MRIHCDLVKSIRTPFGTFRYINGEWDAANGVVWVETGSLSRAGDPSVAKLVSGAKRGGIHLASRTWMEELAPVAALPPAPTPPAGDPPPAKLKDKAPPTKVAA